MSSEQPKLNNSEVNNNSTSGESETAPQQNAMASQSTSAASAARTTETEEADEARSGGDVDFGQLLDQFEQEQATLEEGEVVRGTVVGLSERGVVIDFGYKSEGIVNPAEFTENGQLTVKAGDEVEVLVKSMETADGLPVLSRADAVRMKAWDDLEKAYRDGSSV
jgi:small subunit ribosomal protein S1